MVCLNVRELKDPSKSACLLDELSNLSVDVTAMHETHFICTADSQMLENNFLVLSAFGGHCSIGVLN